jgi:hypothetical protein
VVHRPSKPDLWHRRALLAAVAALMALPAAAAEEEKEGKEDKDDKDDKSQKPLVPGAPIFFNVPAIVLPVVEGNAVTRQVSVLLTVELAEGHRRREASSKRRELTDAFITELYRLYGWRSGANQLVDERLLKLRLQAAADRVLGPGVAHAILIRQLVEQQR